MKKLSLFSAIAAAFMLLSSGMICPVLAKKTGELRMVTMVPDIPPGNAWTRMLINKIAEKSNGELTVKWIGGPEAISMPDTPAAVQRNVIDICSTVLSFAETMVPGIEAIGQAEYDPAEMRANGSLAYIRESGYALRSSD